LHNGFEEAATAYPNSCFNAAQQAFAACAAHTGRRDKRGCCFMFSYKKSSGFPIQPPWGFWIRFVPLAELQSGAIAGSLNATDLKSNSEQRGSIMSILQTSVSSQHASAVLQSLANGKPADVEWPAYAQARDQLAREISEEEQLMNRKRLEARRYLREQACLYGEKYSKAESRVFTPEFVTELGKDNSTRRMQRNPWLESRINGIDEEGREITARGASILPFGPSIGLQDMQSNH
jgi:hypothetical protein